MDLSLVELALVSGTASMVGRIRTRFKLRQLQRSHPVVTSQVPTIFLHGLRGSSKTMRMMLGKAVGYGHHMVTIHVTHAGKMKIHGKWDATDPHPLVQVTFGNNNARISFQIRWLREIMIYLRGKHGIQTYNAVAHSAGCVAMVAYAQSYGHDASLPQLNKMVTIAGPFNGVIGINESHNTNTLDAEGKPRIIYPKNFWFPSYGDLLARKQDFPHSAAVLNIFGDIEDGSHSDRYISTASARSIKYLLQDTARSFQEVGFHGAGAEHSVLHDNPRVHQLVFQFLYGDQSKAQ